MGSITLRSPMAAEHTCTLFLAAAEHLQSLLLLLLPTRTLSWWSNTVKPLSSPDFLNSWKRFSLLFFVRNGTNQVIFFILKPHSIPDSAGLPMAEKKVSAEKRPEGEWAGREAEQNHGELNSFPPLCLSPGLCPSTSTFLETGVTLNSLVLKRRWIGKGEKV